MNLTGETAFLFFLNVNISRMKNWAPFIAWFLALSSPLHAQDTTSAPRDTIYYLSPVVVNPTQARERETPATFSNLNQKHLTERYSIQDIPQLLSELPSITWYSENG